MVHLKKNILMNTFSVVMHGWLPYAAGCIISHCRRDSWIDENFKFMDPGYTVDDTYYEKLLEADILCYSTYIWNQAECDSLARWYKEQKPEGIVCYGGANVPEDEPYFSEYCAERPFVDHFFIGTGEEKFSHFLKTGEIDNTTERRKYTKIDLPTPYSDGVFDRYVKEKTNLVAAIETNRGCPYACSFCDWGGTARSKINRFDIDDIKKELQYIFAHESIVRIEIIDANFGTFERDLEIIEYMVTLQEQRKNKLVINFSGFAKNGSKWLLPIIQLTGKYFSGQHGMSSIKLSFQSHDKKVLNINQRGNIPNEKLYPLMHEFQKKGVDIDAEMIIGLPGETVETFLNSLEINRQLHIHQQKTYMLWALPNTPLYSKEFKEEYGVKTKKMFIPNDLNKLNTKVYHEARMRGEEVYTTCDFSNPLEYSIFETVHECFSYSTQELAEIYDVYFWFNMFYNSHLARQQMIENPLSIHMQYDVYKNTDMPFVKSLQEDYRILVNETVATPGEVTYITKLSQAVWLTKFMLRSKEMYEIYHNQQIAFNEIKQIYPTINTNWKELSSQDQHKLYYKPSKVPHAKT